MPAGAGAAPHCAALSTVSCYHAAAAAAAAAAAGWEQEGRPGKRPDKDLADKGVTAVTTLHADTLYSDSVLCMYYGLFELL